MCDREQDLSTWERFTTSGLDHEDVVSERDTIKGSVLLAYSPGSVRAQSGLSQGYSQGSVRACKNYSFCTSILLKRKKYYIFLFFLMNMVG